MDLVAEVVKKMDAKRNSKQYYAEVYNRYKTAMDEFQLVINKVMESGDVVELERLASTIECDVEMFSECEQE